MEQKAAHSNRQVRLWLLAGVIMLSVQVILGGITRLTGSGLSITEWNLLTGTLPPLSAHDWQIAFGKYQHTPQYRWINADFTIGDFKFIYFWEWLHRLWARLVGLVFLTGLLLTTVFGLTPSISTALHRKKLYNLSPPDSK